MKKVVLTIIMFGISVALLVGVILPIADRAYITGNDANDKQATIDASIGSLSAEIE